MVVQKKNSAYYGWAPVCFTSFQVTQNRVSVFIETQSSYNNKDKTCLIISYPHILWMTNEGTNFRWLIEPIDFIQYLEIEYLSVTNLT